MLSLNLNNKVYVQLTEEGRQLIFYYFRSINAPEEEFPEDENGFTEFTMRDLMSIFGHYVYEGSVYRPFKGNKIYFKNEKLKEEKVNTLTKNQKH